MYLSRIEINPHRLETARGKLVPCTKTDEQRQWLIARAAKCGFEIVRNPYARADGPAAGAPSRDGNRVFGADLNFGVTLCESKKFWRQGELVSIETAVFEGVLRVVDAASLARAMRNGIGRAKAYGCGLLTLALQSERVERKTAGQR